MAARVRGLVDGPATRRRFRHINEFERMLGEEGTTVVKCFLHLSRDEQRERLQARLDDPEKRWKFRRGDLDERKLWDDYMAAYEEALERCSTPTAPWYVVPADRKWYRDLAIADTIVRTLRPFRARWLQVLEQMGGVARGVLQAFRATKDEGA